MTARLNDLAGLVKVCVPAEQQEEEPRLVVAFHDVVRDVVEPIERVGKGEARRILRDADPCLRVSIRYRDLHSRRHHAIELVAKQLKGGGWAGDAKRVDVRRVGELGRG
eukprot:1695613-Prymnesium_polylepis.1